MQGDEVSETILEGVTEYHEGMPVALAIVHFEDVISDHWPAAHPRNKPRIVVKARNEGGYNSTAIDLLDLIAWLWEHQPELLKAPELPPAEKRFTMPDSYRCSECRARLKASTIGPHMRVWCSINSNHQALTAATWNRLKDDLVSGLVAADLDS